MQFCKLLKHFCDFERNKLDQMLEDIYIYNEFWRGLSDL